jgi:integrase
MRRELGSITPHKGQKGVWLVRVTMPGGKRKSKVVRGSKKKAAEELNRLLALAGHTPSNMSFRDFCELKYIPWHDSVYTRPDSQHKFHYVMQKLINELGDMRLSAMRRDYMETWAANATEWRINRMKAIMKKAYVWEYIDRNPLDDVKPHKARPKKERFTLEELKTILAACKDTDIEAGVLLMACCGLRREEAMGLSWTDIDWKRGTVRISRTWHYRDGRGWMEDTKNIPSRRVVTIDPVTLARLQEIRKHGGITRLGALMVSPRTGERMSPATFADKWEQIVKNLPNVRYLPPKNLRHTHASLCLENGVSIEAIAKRLGHGSTTFTESTYANDNGKLEARCADCFGEMFG